MKKMNSKGFTLIELLAVITIMGILMLVAIPAVSRTIENSRRDTFKDLASEYITTVRNGVIADELKCGTKATTSTHQNVSATTAGTFYFLISTKDLGSDGYIKQQTTDLMEKGGKSSWGNNDVVGVVEWKKEASTGVTSGFKNTYSVFLIDAGNHGIATKVEETALSRSNVLANTGTVKFGDITTKATLLTKSGVTGTECWLVG